MADDFAEWTDFRPAVSIVAGHARGPQPRSISCSVSSPSRRAPRVAAICGDPVGCDPTACGREAKPPTADQPAQAVLQSILAVRPPASLDEVGFGPEVARRGGGAVDLERNQVVFLFVVAKLPIAVPVCADLRAPETFGIAFRRAHCAGPAGSGSAVAIGNTMRAHNRERDQVHRRGTCHPLG